MRPRQSTARQIPAPRRSRRRPHCVGHDANLIASVTRPSLGVGCDRTDHRPGRRRRRRPYHGGMGDSTKRVLLAKPRGYCAGVDRAVQTVEEALKLYGAPIYVRKQIVHNKHVVATLEKLGAIFVEENEEVPEGSIVIFSAHGVAPEVYQQARARNLKAIDATCPLVTKVHQEAR